MAKIFVDSLAAADKHVAYEYQFYIFLLKCFEMKDDDFIGYEAKDDVHITLRDLTVYIQVKHTIQTTATGQRPNLTSKDSDLWKSVYNWINNVNDPHDFRGELVSQIEFIKKSEFVLVSNKSAAENNLLYRQMKLLLTEQISFADFHGELEKLIHKGSDSQDSSNTNLSDEQTGSEVDRYIKLFLSQDETWLRNFLSHLKFSLDEDEIIDKIKQQIKERFLTSESQASDIFACSFTNLKTKIFQDVREGRRSVTYSYDEIKRILSACVNPSVNKITVRRYLPVDFPLNLHNQTFVRQLVDIDDIEEDDREAIINFTKFKILMANNLKKWEQEGELLPSMKDNFIEECILKWENIHREKHRNNRNEKEEDQLKAAARACLDDIRKIELKISDVFLETQLSNGQFYLLSDELKIGWRYNWKELFSISDNDK